ncbi:MAG: HAD family phosphatase, partial [Peptostreptococcaceae bacterium]|nr:HAD family phosphatase [Peptostreptococcaceae bacterium]
MKKIIISDMDGTLLKTDKSISKNTINTVNYMRRQDIDFTIATGRIYPVVLDTVDEMNIT